MAELDTDVTGQVWEGVRKVHIGGDWVMESFIRFWSMNA